MFVDHDLICHGFTVKLLESLVFLASTNASFAHCEFEAKLNT
jgi:hypothetical protein